VPDGRRVLSLQFAESAGLPLSVLAVGAHPDDIEIGAGGLLLTLARNHPGLTVRYVLLTGSPERKLEARKAAHAFLTHVTDANLMIDLYDLPEGRLPARWEAVRDTLHSVARDFSPDLIVAPSAGDAHQDHRVIGEIMPTAFRNNLILNYEIPKWDGDMSRPTVYVPLPEDLARRKAQLLDSCYPSQRVRDWWDAELFLGLARLRGAECHSRYAEGFGCSKMTLDSSSS